MADLDFRSQSDREENTLEGVCLELDGRAVASVDRHLDPLKSIADVLDREPKNFPDHFGIAVAGVEEGLKVPIGIGIGEPPLAGIIRGLGCGGGAGL